MLEKDKLNLKENLTESNQHTHRMGIIFLVLDSSTLVNNTYIPNYTCKAIGHRQCRRQYSSDMRHLIKVMTCFFFNLKKKKLLRRIGFATANLHILRIWAVFFF